MLVHESALKWDTLVRSDDVGGEETEGDFAQTARFLRVNPSTLEPPATQQYETRKRG